jgi:hypothetical protein
VTAGRKAKRSAIGENNADRAVGSGFDHVALVNVILGVHFNYNAGAYDGDRTDRRLNVADRSRARNRRLRREAGHNTPISQRVVALPNMLTLPVPVAELLCATVGDFVGLLAKSGA